MTKKWLNHLLEQHHHDAYLWARQCCEYDDDKAKDVLQMVYLKILEGKAKYNQRSGIKTWIFSVIRNTAVDQRSARLNHDNLEEIPDVVENIDLEQEITFDYQQLIQKLPERQQQVLLLVFYHNLTLEEVAKVLELGIGTVRTHYDRGKKTMKVLIQNSTAYG